MLAQIRNTPPMASIPFAEDEFSEFRGGRDIDLDPRAIRQILDEIDDLALEMQASPQVEIRSPTMRECKSKGSHFKQNGFHIVALYGLVASGAHQVAAFDEWRAIATEFMKLEAVA